MTEKSFMPSFDHHSNNTSVREALCVSYNQNLLSEFEKTQDEKSGYDIDVQNLTKVFISVEDGKDVYLNDMPKGYSSLNCTLEENQEMISNVKRDRKYHCTKCTYSTNNSTNFCNHTRIHTGERPFQCEQCPKTFTQKSNLTQHLRIHTGQRPFQCEQCHKTFNKKSTLTQHLRIHTGEKPYQCHHCHKTFTEKGNLTQHLRIHSGERPFLCSTCGMGFRLKSTMNKHQRTHKENMAFQDPLCVAKDSQDPLKIEERSSIPSSTIGPSEEGFFLYNTSGLRFHTLSTKERRMFRDTLQAPLIQSNLFKNC